MLHGLHPLNMFVRPVVVRVHPLPAQCLHVNVGLLKFSRSHASSSMRLAIAK